MRYTLLYIALFLGLTLQGQSTVSNDTINIGDVIIRGRNYSSEPAGYKQTTIDTTILKFSSHNSLAELLSKNSTIFIKSYGMGGTASPSLRGTGAGHTQLAWNDININQPMPGQSDLALIPAGIIDEIGIYYGGASMPLNSGGIGGIINLETLPVWKKETVISLNPGIGSFGQYTGLIKVRTGSSDFQSVTKAFYQSCENDFPYLNTGISSEPVWQKRTNSQITQTGFIQEFYLRNNRSTASARVWYESANRNLPSSMLIQQPNLKETQSDESLRTMLNWDLNTGINKFSITGAWIMNHLNYTNSLASIDSRNLSQTFVLKSGLERRINELTKLKVTLSDELNYINSNNYAEITKRNTFSLTASAEHNISGKLGSTLLLREILDSRNLLIPDFSAGMQYRIADGKDYFLKANVSRNSKIPAMNDMFWVPGGNPELKNEYAFVYEVTWEMNHKISSPVAINYNISLFRNNIKDMIQWLPGEYSYWSAANVKRVNTSGLETSFSLDYSPGSFSSGVTANYSYTKATTVASQTANDASIGKQLIYVPVHQANCLMHVNYKMLYSSWNIVMTGKRYLTAENTDWLPGYMLNNLTTGLRLNLKNNSLELNFQVDNLFDVNYQTIAYYPLPGRAYSLKLLIQIIK